MNYVVALRKHMLKITFKVSNYRYYSQIVQKLNNYSKTVLLPKTKFPLRLTGKKLIERDNHINKITGSDDLYNWQYSVKRDREFILHDGPPYANGPLHMGHAINKILKDIVVRTKILAGYKTHYKPGWDCHGLPIELKAVSNVSGEKKPLEIRKIARDFAKDTIVKQRTIFKTWGILGDWNNAYYTYDKSYVKNLLLQFYNLFEKGLIYRDLKPVYWSPAARTALAEAELEYNDKHVSQTVTLKVELKQLPLNLQFHNKKVFSLIWTTTPWTLPSNQAISYNPSLSYSIVENGNTAELYLLSTDLIENFKQESNLPITVLNTFSGDCLCDITYIQPITGDVKPFIPGDHVTADKGTGLVHIAPAHGPDDYLLALKHNIPIVNLVDESGCYTKETIASLQGLEVLDKGSKAVLDLLSNSILFTKNLVHSYPYDWRTKTPVILRASKQWFIDTESVKTNAARCLEDVSIWPTVNSEKYKRTLLNQLIKRPYWCISRQRSWGVPIPVFYDRRDDTIIFNKEIVNHLIQLLDKHDTDFWWTLPIETLLPSHINDIDSNNVIPGGDILDIWFDSGMSWSSVIPETTSLVEKKTSQVADLYLEGLDQFTGWFQSSLITAVALQDNAPYRHLYIHGHALDENGLKMSKSVGNVVDPSVIMTGDDKKNIPPYGVDTLRWWVACHASRDSGTLISDRVLKASAEEVQKVRSVLRFALSTLYDYNHRENPPVKSLTVLDRYILHVLYKYDKQNLLSSSTFHFQHISLHTLHFLTSLSSLYFPAIKDYLYCFPFSHPSRISSQFTLYQVLRTVSRSIAPVLPHLVEELHQHHPVELRGDEGCFFRENSGRVCTSSLDRWRDDSVERLMERLLEVRKEVNKEVGVEAKEWVLTLRVGEELAREMKLVSTLASLEEELAHIFQVSSVVLTCDSDLQDRYKVEFSKTDKFSCERCRRITSTMLNSLCDRCSSLVESLNK